MAEEQLDNNTDDNTKTPLAHDDETTTHDVTAQVESNK